MNGLPDPCLGVGWLGSVFSSIYLLIPVKLIMTEDGG